MDFLSEPLPEALRIPVAGTHLYNIGLSLYKQGEAKRNFIHNPYLNFFVTITYSMRQFVSILFMEGRTDREYFYFGDYPHFLKARYHINCFINFCFFISVATQAVHFYHYYH